MALAPHFDQILAAAALSHVLDSRELEQLLLRAASLHDLGKANTDFQAMVRGYQKGQAFRHEVLSGFLAVTSTPFRDWFFGTFSEQRQVMIVLAVLGHHLRLTGTLDDLAANGTASQEIELLLSHADFKELLAFLADRLSLPVPMLLPNSRIDCVSTSPAPLRGLQRWLIDKADPQVQQFTPEDRRLLAVLKALLISVDVAGSALPRVAQSPSDWIRDALQPLLHEQDVAALVRRRLSGMSPRPFQEQVREAPALAFVRAGCGSGKTAAAYLWASRHAIGRRLFFCYPTTGTATEGFRDYVFESELSGESALMHGRAAVDLDDILGIGNDDDEQARRLDALRAWPPLLVVCTVDRVLGLLQNSRSALFSFPAIAKGAFVFDEIHLYDDRLFGALIRFLADGLPGAPALLMTASLPEWRQDALEEVSRGRGRPLHIVDGPPDLERLPRYRFHAPGGQPDWNAIERTLRDGRDNKVLWVANTVGRAMEFREQALARGLSPIHCYHSRFRYEDRVQRHKALIEAFRGPGPALAIATQVCEVSLDISADLLVTDLAPIPSLIQRLGRLNRRAIPGACTARSALFLDVASQLPYDDSTFKIDVSRSWVRELLGRDVSQADLADTFEKHEQHRDTSELQSAWLDGGIHSTTAPLRDADVSLPIILARDENQCLHPDGRLAGEQIIRKSLSMPMNRIAADWMTWRRIGYTLIAPDSRIEYSPEVGASWAKS